jgi:hypothetical protein
MENNIEVKEYNLQAIEQYNNLMDVFKDCFKNEAINLLSEAKQEITETMEHIQLLKKENLEIRNDCVLMAQELDKKYRQMDYNE